MSQLNDQPTGARLGSKPLWLMIAAGLAIRAILALVFHWTNHVLVEEIAAIRVRDGDWRGVYEGTVMGYWTAPA
jgi:hypothetical protein